MKNKRFLCFALAVSMTLSNISPALAEETESYSVEADYADDQAAQEYEDTAGDEATGAQDVSEISDEAGEAGEPDLDVISDSEKADQPEQGDGAEMTQADPGIADEQKEEEPKSDGSGSYIDPVDAVSDGMDDESIEEISEDTEEEVFEEVSETEETEVLGAEDNAKKDSSSSSSTVTAGPVVTVSMSEISVTVKKSKKIKIADLKSKERKTLQWKTSDPKVASVSPKGKVKALGRGITYVSAFYPAKNIEYVTKVTVDNPELTQKKVNLVVGEDYWVALTGILSTDVKWTTKKEKAAKLVNEIGSAHFVATAKGSQKYTAVINGKKYKFTVKVKDDTAPKTGYTYQESVLYPATETVKGEKLYTAPNGSAYSEYYTLSENKIIDTSINVKFDLNCPGEDKLYTLEDKYDGLVMMPTVDSFKGATTPKGYTLAGWADSKDAKEALYAPGQKIALNKDAQLYGVWKLIDYKITYVLTDGENAASNPASYTIKDQIIVLGDASKKDCQFEGWLTGAKFDQKIYAIDPSLCEDITLYALYSKSSGRMEGYDPGSDNSKNGNVSVSVNGVSINYIYKPTSELRPEDYVVNQYIPVIIDYDKIQPKPHGTHPFAWALSSVSSSSITDWSESPDFTATENGTYYLWMKTEYGIIKLGEVTINNIDDETPWITVTVSGNDLRGEVSDKRSGLDRVEIITPSGNQVVIKAEEIKNGVIELKDFVKEYGTYIIRVYDKLNNVVTYYYTRILINNPNPSDDDPKDIKESEEWTKRFIKTYNITYHSNDPYKTETVVNKVVDAIKLRYHKPGAIGFDTPIGHKFLGWGLKADSDTVECYTDRYYNIDKDKEFYAVWVPAEYTLFYVLDGGTNNKANPSEYTIDDPDIKLADPSRYGYEFQGWYTDKEFTKKITTVETTSEKDIYLYAKWEKKKFEITEEKGYAGVYDGDAHSISVVTKTPGAIITYSEDGVSFNNANPSYTDAGIYKVYYTISCNSFIDYTNNRTVKIDKAASSQTKPEGKNLTYNESDQILVKAGTVSGGSIYYGLAASETDHPIEWAADLPKAKNVGTYYIWTKVTGDNNHEDIDATYACTSVISKATLGNVSADDQTKGCDGTMIYPDPITCATPESTIKYGEVEGVYTYDSLNNETFGLINAGTKTVYYKVSKYGYNDITGSFKFNLVRTKATITHPTGKNLTYNENPQTLAGEGSASGGTLYYGLSNSKTSAPNTWSLTVPMETNVGTYHIWVKVLADNFHLDVDPVYACTTTISNATLGTVTATNKQNVYSGSAQYLNPVTCDTAGVTITYGTSSGSYPYSSITSTDLGQTNAGIKTVYYKVSKYGYNDKTGFYTLTITKADATMTKPSGKSLTYNEAAQTLVTAGSAVGGTIQYAIGTSSTSAPTSGWSTNLPTATSVGTYYIWSKVVGDNNHNDVDATYACSTTIKAATLGDVTALSASKVYNGSAQYLNAVTCTTSGVTITYGTSSGSYPYNSITNTDLGLTNVGTKTVYYKVSKNGYNDKTGSYVLTITKANATMNKPSGKTLVYSEAEQTLITAGSAVGGTILYGLGTSSTVAPSNWSSGLPSATNVGTYYIWSKVEGDNNHNDVAATYACSTTISAATLGTITASNITKTYTGSAQYLSPVVCSTPNVTITYGTSNGSYPYDSITNTNLGLTDVGTKTVYYKVSKTGYNDKTGSCTLTIAKADARITTYPTIKALTYNETAQEVVTAGVAVGGTLQYGKHISTDVTEDDIHWSTSIPTSTGNETLHIWVRVLGDSNHNNLPYEYIGQINVSNASLGTITATSLTKTYDGSAQYLNAVTCATSGVTIKYGTSSGSYTYTSITNSALGQTGVGTKTVYYQITKTGYNTKAGSYTLTITKASGSMTKPTAKTGLAYTGSAQTLVNAGSANSTGIIYYGLGSSTTSAPTSWSATLPSATNVGTYYVWSKVTGDSNHNDVSAAYACTTSISSATLGTITASNTSKTYTGSAQYLPAVTCATSGTTIAYGISSGSYSYSSITNSNLGLTNVGTKTVYYQVSKSGYTTQTGSYTLTITKAASSMTKPTAKTNLVYNGSAQTLVNAGSASGGTIQYGLGSSTSSGPSSYSATLPSATNVGTYYVWSKVVGDSNHNDKAGEYACTVSIASNKAGSVTLYYNTSNRTDVDYAIGDAVASGTVLASNVTSGTYDVNFSSGSNHDSYAIVGKAAGMKNRTITLYVTVTTGSSYAYTYHSTATSSTAPTASSNLKTQGDNAPKNASTTIDVSTNSDGYFFVGFDFRGASHTYPVSVQVVSN